MQIWSKIKQYIPVMAVTLMVLIIYLICFGFEITKPVALDMDKPMDNFIRLIVEGDGVIPGNVFSACDFNLQNFVVAVLGNVLGNMWAGVNVYYILSFFMISAAMYWYLQKLSVSTFSSVSFAVITAFLPFHVNRGEGQMLTSNYFLVPLFMGILYENIYKKKQDVINKIYVVLMCTAPFIDARVSVMMLILFIILLIHRNEAELIKTSVWYLAPLAVFTLISGVLSSVFKVSDVKSNMEMIQAEGLRILDMLMPVRYHIIRRLSDFRLKYDIGLSVSGENGLNTMGMLISIGFVFGMLALFFHQKADKRIIWLSWINIIVIIISNIHGLNMLFEYLGIHVVYWNRMGIFILVGSAAITAMLADELKQRLNKYAGKVLPIVGLAIIFVAALLELLLRQNMVI